MALFLFPFFVLFSFVFILRRRNQPEKNKYLAKFKRVLDSGLLFGFVLVEKEEEVGREKGYVCRPFF